MVYCGKPSNGCERCRRKRVKCDQKIPECTQCRHASSQCSGYRNQVDLMFRDESLRVKQKVQSTQASKVSSERESKSPSPLKSPTRSLDLKEATPEPQPVVLIHTDQRKRHFSFTEQLYPSFKEDLYDVSASYFLSNYIPGSHFDCLPFLLSTTPTDNVLFTVLQAVSLASLSHGTQNPGLMRLARRQYSRGLAETNLAIQDPVACLDNTTIAAVLLLAHFETLASDDVTWATGTGSDETGSWFSPAAGFNRHVQGARSLISMRPTLDNASPITVKLHQHVNGIARYCCIQRQIRLPDDLTVGANSIHFARDDLDPDRRFMSLSEEFTELRAAVAEGSIDTTKTIEWAESIDTALALFTRGIPSMWAYDVVTTSRTRTGVYKNQYHLYPNHRAAQAWNEVRMIRLALNRTILGYCEPMQQRDDTSADDKRVLAQIRRSERNIDHMATEICQSTTQFLQTPGKERHSIASAYFLIWPLFTAATAYAVVTPAGVTSFAIDRLHYIGREMKVPQARKAAVMLEEGIVEEDWLHMLHLF